MQLTRGRSLARRPSRLLSPKEGRRPALPLVREACAQLIGKDVSPTMGGDGPLARLFHSANVFRYHAVKRRRRMRARRVA